MTTVALNASIRTQLNAVALELPADIHWSDLVDAVMCVTTVPDDQVADLEQAAKNLVGDA